LPLSPLGLGWHRAYPSLFWTQLSLFLELTRLWIKQRRDHLGSKHHAAVGLVGTLGLVLQDVETGSAHHHSQRDDNMHPMGRVDIEEHSER
jgi:hypothetical protein